MKRLILGCDGTWNSADQAHDGVPCPTNVVRLVYRVAKRDGAIPQFVYYHEGVGTGNQIDRLTGGAFGHGLESNIHDAYRFLVANYEPGDQLFLFGFSRGAFTARSVAGMIRKCGILRRECVDRYLDAIRLYRNDEHPDDPGPREFRLECSVSPEETIPIWFIGVWDTVGSLGIPVRGLRWLTRRKYEFHDTELSGSVKNAYHALAIDERRAPFEPTLWCHKPKEDQVVEQIWFCGVHSDVGGGYPERGLSDITLRWMMAKASDRGLAFDQTVDDRLALEADPLGKLHNSKKGLYVITPGVDREIGLVPERCESEATNRRPDPTQGVHDSVLTRRAESQKYDPPSLRDYLGRSSAREEEN